MRLHIYDHCPYCVRVRLAFGLLGLPVELVYHSNDDEETPIRMIGRKTLPILEDSDGFMGESLDIVCKIDGYGGRQFFDGKVDPAIANWIDRWQDIIHRLVLPRNANPVFPEFSTQEARAYYMAKKEGAIGSFDALLRQTPELVARMSDGLADVEPILPDPEGTTINDIVLFPVLRSLSIVPGLSFPARTAAYRNRVAARAGIPVPEPLNPPFFTD